MYLPHPKMHNKCTFTQSSAQAVDTRHGLQCSIITFKNISKCVCQLVFSISRKKLKIKSGTGTQAKT